MNELISVIVPVYNVSKFIDQCLNSIQDQTYKNIEAILIDDGSTDDSANICEKHCEHDSRFKLIRIKNSGQGVARNIGIDKANGTWLVFVDSDDYLANNAIESLLKGNDGADIVVGNYCLHDREIKKMSFFVPDYERKTYKLDLIGNALGTKKYGAYSTNIGVPWGKLYRKQFIKENKVYFPDIRRMQDTIFNIRAFNADPVVKFIDDYVYYYRVDINSVTHKYWSNFDSISSDIRSELRRLLDLNSKEYYDLYNYKSNCLLLETIKLQLLHQKCSLNKKEKVAKLKQICSTKEIRESLNKINLCFYGEKQCVILILLRFKLYRLVLSLFFLHFI